MKRMVRALDAAAAPEDVLDRVYEVMARVPRGGEPGGAVPVTRRGGRLPAPPAGLRDARVLDRRVGGRVRRLRPARGGLRVADGSRRDPRAPGQTGAPGMEPRCSRPCGGRRRHAERGVLIGSHATDRARASPPRPARSTRSARCIRSCGCQSPCTWPPCPATGSGAGSGRLRKSCSTRSRAPARRSTTRRSRPTKRSPSGMPRVCASSKQPSSGATARCGSPWRSTSTTRSSPSRSCASPARAGRDRNHRGHRCRPRAPSQGPGPRGSSSNRSAGCRKSAPTSRRSRP